MAESKELPVKNIVNIGLLIAGFLVVRKVLTTFGIVKTAEEKQQEEQSGKLEEGSETQADKVDATKPELSLNPNYWRTLIKAYKKNVMKGKEIGKERINLLLNPDLTNKFTFPENMNRLAFTIKNSKGIFNDNENALYNVFQKAKNQLQISYLSDTFQKLNNKDMLNYIKEFTNEEERAKLFRIIKNKPLY